MMVKKQRLVSVGLVSLLAMIALYSHAQTVTSKAYEAGKHYTVIQQPVATKASYGQVEVVELFNYACPHCLSFYPHISAWEQRKPSHVFYRRVPAMFNPTFQVFGRAYITADVLGIAEDTHAAMFAAIHTEKRAFRSMNDIADFYTEHGIEAEKFLSTAESFSVVTRMTQENNDARRYGLRGTPSLVVNGKYLISANAAVPSHQAMLNVADFLVAQEFAMLSSELQDDSATDETAES